MIKLHFGGIIKCYICGKIAKAYIKDWNLRETCICSNCKSTNRQRQVAYVLCKVLEEEKKVSFKSLEDIITINNFAIYNTEAGGPLHNTLVKSRKYTFSEFFNHNYSSGTKVKGVLHQDLTKLSFKEQSFDLVISGDVFEHIPDPYKAHKEVYRVLKSGGRHIFTVPFYQTEYFDEVRAQMSKRWKNILIKPPLFHQDPIREEGVLVYTIFGLEMLIKLAQIGFKTHFYKLYLPLHGIIGPNAIVFEAIKS
ncbi:methyltransferase domain-containing protein [Candidatus Daviesbacteria bacterium]|nr:methyltransferase domain-containing protein [Candidatus Daviesbacteria bacterium]